MNSQLIPQKHGVLSVKHSYFCLACSGMLSYQLAVLTLRNLSLTKNNLNLFPLRETGHF